MKIMTQKNSKGQTFIILNTIISLILVSLFSQEMNKSEIVKRELELATKEAALVSTTTLLKQENIDPTIAQTNALQSAIDTFQKNRIIGLELNKIFISSTEEDHCASSNSASLYIEFLDPNNQSSTLALGNPRAKLVKISSSFMPSPSLTNLFGLYNIPIKASFTHSDF